MSENTTATKSKKNWITWLIYAMWTLAILGCIAGVYLFTSISKGDLPSFEELENPQYDLASIVYDTNNKTFGKYYIENREPIRYDELSPDIVKALIATEDARFFEHKGIDVRALFRVAFKTVLMGDDGSGGGSTISQQLAKLLFVRPNLRGMSSIKRSFKLVEVKLKEWITAVKLEKSYTKEEIMTMYLNKFEFINGAHGIQAAAETYFNKRQEELSVDEAAILVGMLKNPSLYNPRRFPEKAKKRRNIVLAQMKKYDELSQEAYDTLSVKNIDMSQFTRETQSEGLAPYFRSELTKWLKDLLAQEEHLNADGNAYNIYKDGLKIYTTIDLKYQEKAEAAVISHMKSNQKSFWNVWSGKDPWSFEADENQKAIRYDVLERKVKASDRYLSLRESIIGESLSKIDDKYNNLPMSDNVIKTLMSIDEGKSSFNGAVSNGKLKKNRVEEYKELMSKKGWSNLKSEWATLLSDYERIFRKTKVKMMVFDYNEQHETEKEMTPYDSVRYHSKHLQAGMLAVDPNTGYIKAWVGGINHKYFKYDHVNSRRQVGSTIKPFVYTTAIALQGISPCQEYYDIQYSIAPGDASFDLDQEWSPSNANGKFTGNKYNLYQGLLYSKNSITVRLVKEMGSVNVIRELMDNVGIKKNKRIDGGRLAVPNLPSMCLGAADLTLREMTGAYTTFANNGVYTEPVFINRIEDKNGKVIYTGVPERNVAINPAYNAVMVDMLKNNVGAGFGMGIKSEIGGKTGTTNDYTDGWFMGITPELVVGTWVGGDDRWIRFLSLDQGQGFVMARPIAQKFIKALESDESTGYNPNAKFVKPPAEYFDIVDCERYKQVTVEEEQSQTLDEKVQRDEFEEEEFEEEEFEEEEF